MNRKKSLKNSVRQSTRRFAVMLPTIAGVLALTSLISAALPPQAVVEALLATVVPDTLIGAVIGGVSAGHPTVSYLLAGELRGAGVSLAAVTAFLVSWVTVGVVQLPAESAAFGLRFALWRNVVSFFLAVAIGYGVEALVQTG
jgi:uncharacterized membrane protein YraQ (UPF0718 family)